MIKKTIFRKGIGMRAKSTFRYLLIPLVIFSLAGPAAAQPPQGPTEQLSNDIDAIVSILRTRGLEAEEKADRITVLVKRRFDFEAMSRLVLAVNWRRASEEQKARFSELFADLLEANYRGRMEDYISEYSDEHVEYGSETIRDGRALVETLLVTDTREFPISYKMLQKEGEWLIYDVEIEGVSLVRNFRSTYDEIVRREGIDRLLERMEEKIRERKSASAGKTN
jgi:phospholipid transport system substrate-binding protein